MKMRKQKTENDPITYCLQETHLTYKDIRRLNISGWKR